MKRSIENLSQPRFLNLTSVLPIAAASLLCLINTSCEKSDSSSVPNSEAAVEAKEGESGKPTQHLKVPDVTNAADARKIFQERTAEILGKKNLDNIELHEIHMSTYHLEKAIAFFAETLDGPRKETAKKMAVVVEEIHLSSETLKTDKAREHIKRFGELAGEFAKGFPNK